MKKIFLSLTIFVLAASLVFAEAKNALLIANAAYPNAPLGTPLQDARGLKQTLERLNFKVTLVENADISAMEKAVNDFGYLLKSRGGIGFFHYGGHAVQIAGKNYLIPARTDISNETQIKRLSLDLDELMENMQGDTNIVILDSCRDNPFFGATRGASRGLALSHVKPKNSIIVYSAEAGNKAQDGVFTPILTKKLLEKKSLHSILLDVRREVNKVTGGQQLPKNDDGLLDDVYLAGYASAGSSSVPEPEPEPVTVAADNNSSNQFFNKKDWEKESSDYAMWAAVDTGDDLGAMANKVVTLAELKSGAHLYRIKTLGDALSPFCTGNLYPSYFVYSGILGRTLGIKKSRTGLCIARAKKSKEKSLPSAAIAAAEKSGWKTVKVASVGDYTVELELQFKDEKALKSYLNNYERASDELADILKAAQ